VNYLRQITRDVRQGISNPAGWAAALLIAIALGAAPLAESMDTTDEWAESQALIDSELAAAELARKEHAANEICGNAVALWIDETTFTCAQRKGPKQSGAVSLAGGVL
jgi:hypothetical protein